MLLFFIDGYFRFCLLHGFVSLFSTPNIETYINLLYLNCDVCRGLAVCACILCVSGPQTQQWILVYPLLYILLRMCDVYISLILSL